MLSKLNIWIVVVMLGLMVMPIAAEPRSGNGRSGPSGPDLSDGYFFEDFNYSSSARLVSAGWNITGQPVVPTGSTVILDNDGTDGSLLRFNRSLDFADYTVEVRARWIGRSFGNIFMASIFGSNDVSWSASADGQNMDYVFEDNGTRSRYGSYAPQMDSWHVLKMVKTGSLFFFYDDGNLVYQHFGKNIFKGIEGIGLQSGFITSSEIDWIRISRQVPDSGLMKIDLSVEKQSYIPGEEIKLDSIISGIETGDYYSDWSRILPAAQAFFKLGRIASDGEYLYIIGTKKQPGGQVDAQLTKMDTNGTEKWNRTWGIPDENIPLDLILHNDTIYIVGDCGDGIYPDPIFLLAYNTSGSELWNRTWTRPGNDTMDFGTGLVCVGDAIYISGWSLGFGADGIEAFVVKFNLTSRSFEWYRPWGGAGDQFSEDIAHLNNSLYLAVYDSGTPGPGGFAKYDLDGNLVWNKTWGNDTGVFSMTTDGVSLFMVGSENEDGNRSAFLRICSEPGEVQMEKKIEKPGFTFSLNDVRVRDNIAYCAGTARNISRANSSDAFVIGYDVNTGAEVFNFTWGGDNEEICDGITILGDTDIYFTGGTKSFSPGSWELFIVKYTNRSRLADIPAAFSINDSFGREFLNISNGTGPSGNASSTFTIPLDLSEGNYTCTVSADFYGMDLNNSTSFKVVWPWSPVLNVTSSVTQRNYIPGEFIAVSAYAGYEYLPGRANISAPGTYLSEDILAPNETMILNFMNRTDDSGWTDLGFTIPNNCSAGIHTVQIRGFEGLNRTLQFSVQLPVKHAPPGDKDPVDIPVEPIVGTTAICLIAICVAIGATETGKFGVFVPFVPLYTRIRRDKALSQRVRHEIMGYLLDNPGQHYNAIKKALKLSNSVMVYHLIVLEREGFIKSQHDGTMKRFYPVSVQTPEIRKRTPKELVAEIMVAVEERPGITHKEMVERLVVGNEVVKYHMRKLVRNQSILSSKKGNTRVYYPTGKK